MAFVPDGTDIPKPPSEPQLDKLTDIGTTPVPDELATTTTSPFTTETSVVTDPTTIPPETTTPPPAP